MNPLEVNYPVPGGYRVLAPAELSDPGPGDEEQDRAAVEEAVDSVLEAVDRYLKLYAQTKDAANPRVRPLWQRQVREVDTIRQILRGGLRELQS